MFDLAISDRSPSLVVLIFVGSVLSFVYMFQLYRRRIAAPVEDEDHGIPVQAVSLVLAIAIVAIGIFPEPLLQLVRVAAETLPGGLIP